MEWTCKGWVLLDDGDLGVIVVCAWVGAKSIVRKHERIGKTKNLQKHRKEYWLPRLGYLHGRSL